MKYVCAVAFLLLSLAVRGEDLFAEDSTWQTVATDHQFAEGMAFDRDGNLIFTDVPRGQLFRVDKDSGARTLLDGKTGRTNGIAFGPDGLLYGCAGADRKIYAWNPKHWKKSTVAEGPHSNDLAIRQDGTIFFTDPQSKSIWRVTAPPERNLEKAAALAWNPNGITLSSDQQTLYVAEFFSNKIHAFAIGADNSLGKDEIGFLLQVPENGKGNLDGMLILQDGRVLSGTVLGAQVARPASHPEPDAGRILVPIPNQLPRCNYVRISPDQKWLYAAHATTILRRALHPAFLTTAPQP